MDFSTFLPWDRSELEVTNNILIKCLKLYGEILSGNLIRYYDYYIGKGISNTLLTFTHSKNYSENYVISDSSIKPGKWYWEHKILVSGTIKIGVADTSYPNVDSTWFYNSNGTITNKTTVISAPTYTTNDIIGIALDTEKGFIYFSKNNTFIGSIVGETPLFNNLYGLELFSCVELGTSASVEIVFNPLNYSVTDYYNGIYDYVTNVEQGLEELQFFWDVYRTKVLAKYKSILDPNDIVKKIQDINSISNNVTVGNPAEQAYFLNLPELLKSKGTIKSLQGIFKFFGITVVVVPWYDPGYLNNARTGVLLRLTFGGENVANEEIYVIVQQLVNIVLDVCAVLLHIDVFKEFETESYLPGQTMDEVLLGLNKCSINPTPANGRKDLAFIPMFTPPFKGFFTGLETCNTGTMPDYSGIYATNCPYLYDCYETTRPINLFISDPSLKVGNYNRDIIGVTDGRGNIRIQEYLQVPLNPMPPSYTITLREIPIELFINNGSDTLENTSFMFSDGYSIMPNSKTLVFNSAQAGKWMSVTYLSEYDGIKNNIITPVYGDPYVLKVGETVQRVVNNVSVFPSYSIVTETAKVGSTISWYPFIVAWNEVLIVKDWEIRSSFPDETITFTDLDTPWLVQPISDLYTVFNNLDFEVDPDMDFNTAPSLDFEDGVSDYLDVDSSTESINEVAWIEEILYENRLYTSSVVPTITDSRETIEKSYNVEIMLPTTDLSLIDYQNFEDDSTNVFNQWTTRSMSYAYVDENNIEWPYFHYYGIITLPIDNPTIGVNDLTVGEFIIGGAYNFIRDLIITQEENWSNTYSFSKTDSRTSVISGDFNFNTVGIDENLNVILSTINFNVD